MYDISLTMPAIRQHNWVNFYNSIKKSCENYSYELVIVSPFQLPDELKDKSNILHIVDYGNPSRATQIANIRASGEFIYNCVDDGIFMDNNCIDKALTFFKRNCRNIDVINMRYREAVGRTGLELPLGFWRAWTHPELRLKGIHMNWDFALHFLMRRKLYFDFGGIDCQFEYSNHGIHDLIFRIQAAGGKIYHSEVEGLNCSHYPGTTKDHKPIHDAQIGHDEPIFSKMYEDPLAAFNRKVELDNWEQSPTHWDRRFKGKIPLFYEDLL